MGKIKILVCYHKKAPLLSSNIFVPIHLGRAVETTASKDGFVNNADLKWLHENLIGDDTGENISSENRYLCEMTGVYWAWKNYAQLENPEYIGLMHYRTLIYPFNRKVKNRIP